MKLPKYFKNLVNELEKLPSLGPRSAMRLGLYLIQDKDSNAGSLVSALKDARSSIQICKECGALSDSEICDICDSHERNHSKICIVENIIDMLALERAGFFDGIYHVLGGVISPLDDVSIETLNIDSLMKRLDGVEEIIYSLPSSVESDATFLILKDMVENINPNIRFSKFAIGLPVGGNIDYTDNLTLIRSFENRIGA
jgi:recombination protein RecR